MTQTLKPPEAEPKPAQLVGGMVLRIAGLVVCVLLTMVLLEAWAPAVIEPVLRIAGL